MSEKNNQGKKPLKEGYVPPVPPREIGAGYVPSPPPKGIKKGFVPPPPPKQTPPPSKKK